MPANGIISDGTGKNLGWKFTYNLIEANIIDTSMD